MRTFFYIPKLMLSVGVKWPELDCEEGADLCLGGKQWLW